MRLSSKPGSLAESCSEVLRAFTSADPVFPGDAALSILDHLKPPQNFLGTRRGLAP